MADDATGLLNQCPFLECRNCKVQIFLPLPTPEEISSLPKVSLSKTWHRTFLCLTCAHMFVYTARDLQFGPPRRRDPKQGGTGQDDHPKSFSISLAETACALEGCTGRLRFHIAANLSEQSSRTIPALMNATVNDVFFDCGHSVSRLLPMTQIPDCEWWIDS